MVEQVLTKQVVVAFCNVKVTVVYLEQYPGRLNQFCWRPGDFGGAAVHAEDGAARYGAIGQAV